MFAIGEMPPGGWLCGSLEETMKLGEAMAAALPAGTVLSLEGHLGTGKTQLVKGLAAGLGFHGEVSSPTFTLVHEYTGGRLPLIHCDLYRVKDEAELASLGLDDLYAGSICAVEWGGKFAEALPGAAIRLQFAIESPGERRISLIP